VTDDHAPERPTGPTPEEISARLEALLKRTHALRQAQATTDASAPDGGTAWPPPDVDLAAVDVVDVPDTAESAEVAAFTSEFGRPDWSSLRLREPVVETPGTPAWVWLVIAALVTALGLESAYLLRTAPWALAAADATAPSLALRIDGASSLQVRVNDEGPRPLPLERTVDGGDLRLAIETATAPAVATPPARRDPALSAPTAIATPATVGSVLIETTPPGAVVVMEGRERGVTPLTIGQLRPGRHDVVVAGTGWRRALKVDVTAGQTAHLTVTRPGQP
jgi:hypothetical protein